MTVDEMEKAFIDGFVAAGATKAEVAQLTADLSDSDKAGCFAPDWGNCPHRDAESGMGYFTSAGPMLVTFPRRIRLRMSSEKAYISRRCPSCELKDRRGVDFLE